MKKKINISKKITSLVLLGSVCLSAALSVTCLTKSVKVVDGTEEIVVNTMDLSTNAILNKAGITLGSNDKVVCMEDENGNLEVSILRAFNVDVIADGQTKTISFVEGTVGDALKASGMTVGINDKISYAANTELTPDMEIKIARWYNITLKDANVSKDYQVPEGTVEDTLKFLNVTLNKDDNLNCELKDEVSEDMLIQIDRVTYKEFSETSAVSYQTIRENTDTLYMGESKIETAGVEGVRVTQKRQTYINGKLEKEEIVSSKVTKEPVNEVVLNGTKEKVSMVQTNWGNIYDNQTAQILTDADGNQVHYSQLLTGTGTAYTAPEGALTSTGRLAQYGVVAVNPNIIPYGTRLYIMSTDGEIVYGYAIAGDTGGGMMAGWVLCDLYYPTFDDCSVFGCREIAVYVLD